MSDFKSFVKFMWLPVLLLVLFGTIFIMSVKDLEESINEAPMSAKYFVKVDEMVEEYPEIKPTAITVLSDGVLTLRELHKVEAAYNKAAAQAITKKLTNLN